MVVENYRDANGGFMKFSDRTLIQWSRASLGGSGTLNFYQAYASAESYIILGLRNAGSSTTNLGIKSFTANSVTYTNANTGNFHWVAIGTY